MDSLNISGYIRRLDQAINEAREAASTKKTKKLIQTEDDFDSLCRYPITHDEGPLALSCHMRCLANQKDCIETSRTYTLYRRPCSLKCCKAPRGVIWKYTELCEKGLQVALEGHNKGIWIFHRKEIVSDLSSDLTI